MIRIIYPENRMVSEETVISWAHDEVANSTIGDIPEELYSAALEAIPRPSLEDAIAILEDVGAVTFAEVRCSGTHHRHHAGEYEDAGGPREG